MLENLPDAIGHALADVRAGMEKTAALQVDLRAGAAAIVLTSLAFSDHAPIPALYTADGDGRSPPLSWTGVPDVATEVVLIVEDADAPTPQPLVHAIVVGLPPGDGALAESSLSEDGPAESLHTGRNSFLGSRWLAPDPPPGHGTHRYVFQLFALEGVSDWSGTPGRDELLEAVAERGLASGRLIGTYRASRCVGSQRRAGGGGGAERAARVRPDTARFGRKSRRLARDSQAA
jgi:Raf kinase inhibitor-like YbhB/YbcL family protein